MSGGRGYPWRYALFLSAFYTVTAAYQGFGGLYYQWRGMTDDRLMVLLTVAPAVALVTQPLWGRIGDRLRYRNTAMLVMAAVGVLSSVLMAFSKSFAMLMLSTALFAGFYLAVQPMGDSIILEDLARRGQPFGPIRLTASVAFALVNLVLGAALKGRYHLAPAAMAVLAIGLFTSLGVLPKAPGYQHGKKTVPMRALLALPYMKPLLALLTLLTLSLGYFYAYYSLHVSALPGGSAGWIGLGYFLSAFSEIPFLLLSDKLFKKYGAGRLMLVSALFLAVRFTILAVTRSVLFTTLSQILHGGCFIVITLAMSFYINRAVPDELRASGQMLLSVAGYGLARVFGTLGGGWIAKVTGGTAGGFAAMAGLCFLTLLWAAPIFLKAPPVNGEMAQKNGSPA